ETFPGAADIVAGRLIHAVHASAPAVFKRLLEAARLSELLTVPLIYEGAVEGVVSCGLAGTPGFREDQKELLAQLAPHLALFIRTARLEAEHARLATRRTQIARWG